MNREEIKLIVGKLQATRERNMVIIDYGNVQKWEQSLGWKIGIKELGTLVKNFSIGKQLLRRFYYGSDFGPNDNSIEMISWSKMILDKANWNKFDIVTKRVKYIHNSDYRIGFVKKCDLDVEIAIDLIKNVNEYDTLILFSGDGDMAYVARYLKEKYNKNIYVFGARNHVGKEIYDAKLGKIIDEILYTEDFEYRLDMHRFK